MIAASMAVSGNACQDLEWFWDQYLPDVSKRADIHVSPINASFEQLKGLPRRYSSSTRTTCCATRGRPMGVSSRRRA
jgi:hypothetical protein